MNPFYFAITTELPATDVVGNPIKDDAGNTVYETNYFCKVLTHPEAGFVMNEWDTDKRFAARFENETLAENFRRVVLESLEGTKVVKLIPSLNTHNILNLKKGIA